MIPGSSGEWHDAARTASALVRAVYGPTARVRYIDVTTGRSKGRSYYVHVADEQAPLHHLRVTTSELERLRIEHGPQLDLEVTRRMLAHVLATPGPISPAVIEHGHWAP